jgi:hypothetical protein
MTAHLDCTPPRASLDPPNEALTDKHFWNLMIHSYGNETPLGLSRMNNEHDDADSLSKASPTEKVRAKLCASVQMCVRLFLHTLVPPRSCPR